MKEFARVCRKGVIVYVNITQPISPIVNGARKALGESKLRRTNPGNALYNAEHLCPMTMGEFRSLLQVFGLYLVDMHNVTWFWGQTKICLIGTQARFTQR